jgi:hypothetical protein
MAPSILLGFILSSLYGLVFFVAFGQSWLQLFFFWGVSVLFFFLGLWLASFIGLGLFNVGSLNWIEGTVASCLSLWASRWWLRK